MDEITPADNLKGYFVRSRSGVVYAVLVDQRFGRNGDRLEVQPVDAPGATTAKPTDIEAIATTAELARAAPAKY